jgi:hypothetical protein
MPLVASQKRIVWSYPAVASTTEDMAAGVAHLGGGVRLPLLWAAARTPRCCYCSLRTPAAWCAPWTPISGVQGQFRHLARRARRRPCVCTSSGPVRPVRRGCWWGLRALAAPLMHSTAFDSLPGLSPQPADAAAAPRGSPGDHGWLLCPVKRAQMTVAGCVFSRGAQRRAKSTASRRADRSS